MGVPLVALVALGVCGFTGDSSFLGRGMRQGCFQDGSARGKLQYGPAWWFLDNKVGMEKHLEDLTATGHIGAFVGMLTDSRSFLSYPRHHYFRRILCNYLGGLMEKNEITQDMAFVGKVVQDICFFNSETYLGMKK